jgi:hypothetical protein
VALAAAHILSAHLKFPYMLECIADLNGELWRLVDFETGFVSSDGLSNLTSSDLYILRVRNFA